MTNKIAAENLSSNQNEINMKKVKINAQVTSIVCIMETAIVFINWILLSQLVFWISIFVLYLIILPYFRLVNTSHNKDRVVEYGWKNVLGNLFGNKWRLNTSFRKGQIQKNSSLTRSLEHGLDE